MIHVSNRIKSFIPVIICLLLLADMAFFARDALGRAGRGESYRSRESSSSRESPNRDRDSPDRYRSHLNPSSSGERAGYHSIIEYVPGEYENDFTINSWYTVLTVNRDGSVDAVETFDVNTHREQKGIARNVANYFNVLLISGLSCPQGHAGYRASQSSGLQFAFGYDRKAAAGRHTFILKYNAIGMVVPSAGGARLQMQADPDKNSMMKNVMIVLPAGGVAQNVKAVEGMTWDRFLRPEKEMSCLVAGNNITVPVNREFIGRLYITADLPAGVIDPDALRKSLAQALEKQNLPSISEYRTSIIINPDRSVEREDAYLPAPDNAFDRATMWHDTYFHSAFFPDGSTAEAPQHVNNQLYLYGFAKKPCHGDDITYGSVCVPLDKTGRAQTDLRYSMWGNFNPEEPFLYEFNFPPVETKWTGRVHFEITFPAFVNRELVKVMLYLARYNGSQTSQRREVAFESRWDGNRLKGGYDAALIDRQLVQARIFLPDHGFGQPGAVKKLHITLAYYWYFERLIFIGALAAAGLLLAGISVLIVFFIKRIRKGR